MNDPNVGRRGADAGPRPGRTLLSRFVASVLCDVARAQHVSNRYTVKLAEIYRHHELLSSLPIPNGRFRELELDARLGLGTPLREAPDENDRQLALSWALEAALPLLAEDALRALAGVLATGPERFRDLAANVESDAMHRYAARRLQTAVLQQDSRYFDPASGTVERARLEALLPGLVGDALRAHAELREPLSERSLMARLDQALRQHAAAWSELIDSGAQATIRLFAEPGLEVITDSSDTAVAGDLAASMKLRVELRDYRWVVNLQTGPGGDEITASRLVPDDR